MNRRLGGDASLNAPIREDGDAGEWQDWLVDDSADQEARRSPRRGGRQPPARRWARRSTVLNERERRIFEARRLADDPITLEELAAEFGVSRERVRQIEVRAFEKVQKAVKNRVAAMESAADATAPRCTRGSAARHIQGSEPGIETAGLFHFAGAQSRAVSPPFMRLRLGYFPPEDPSVDVPLLEPLLSEQHSDQLAHEAGHRIFAIEDNSQPLTRGHELDQPHRRHSTERTYGNRRGR